MGGKSVYAIDLEQNFRINFSKALVPRLWLSSKYTVLSSDCKQLVLWIRIRNSVIPDAHPDLVRNIGKKGRRKINKTG
jgi:hypothetical protein